MRHPHRSNITVDRMSRTEFGWWGDNNININNNNKNINNYFNNSCEVSVLLQVLYR